MQRIAGYKTEDMVFFYGIDEFLTLVIPLPQES